MERGDDNQKKQSALCSLQMVTHGHLHGYFSWGGEELVLEP